MVSVCYRHCYWLWCYYVGYHSCNDVVGGCGCSWSYVVVHFRWFQRIVKCPAGRMAETLRRWTTLSRDRQVGVHADWKRQTNREQTDRDRGRRRRNQRKRAREREGERQTDRTGERESDRERKSVPERDRQKEQERGRAAERERECQREKETDRDSQREGEWQREWEEIELYREKPIINDGYIYVKTSRRIRCASMHLKLNATKTESLIIWFDRRSIMTRWRDQAMKALNHDSNCSTTASDEICNLCDILFDYKTKHDSAYLFHS